MYGPAQAGRTRNRHRARLRQPQVVEDMVRRRRSTLNADDRIEADVVESEEFRAHHNHSAYALIGGGGTSATNALRNTRTAV